MNDKPYPKPFYSGHIDIGSMTVDSGHSFRVSVDDNGFHVVREIGPIDPHDLFNELKYWPEHILWDGESPSLKALCKDCAKACESGGEKVQALILSTVKYLPDNEAKVFNMLINNPNIDTEDLRVEPFEVIGLPSPLFGSDTNYNALRISFGDRQWKMQLHGETGYDIPELLISTESWHGQSFDELFETKSEGYSLLEDVLPWSRKSLSDILLNEDTLWGGFL